MMRSLTLLLFTLLASPALAEHSGLEKAYFAGGCFWCTEADFEKLDGVKEVVSGFSGGELANPSYAQVTRGGTGHTETVQVQYDPAQVSYAQLLDWFWQHIDPTDPDGQFVDRGDHYRSAIFYQNDEEKAAALASRQQLAEQGPFQAPIVTEISAFRSFYPAEEYHQDYYLKNPLRYRYYRHRSGRDQFLRQHWQDRSWPPQSEAVSAWRGPEHFQRPSEAQLKQQLSPLAYRVTRQDATERAFDNPYWDHWEDGLYVDVISGEPLFSARDKYRSGTGWPSFTQALEKQAVTYHQDRTLWMTRTEVRSRHADSHLGHVFDDGPAPTGKRYCINAAALRFVPKAEMAELGYQAWLDQL